MTSLYRVYALIKGERIFVKSFPDFVKATKFAALYGRDTMLHTMIIPPPKQAKPAFAIYETDPEFNLAESARVRRNG